MNNLKTTKSNIRKLNEYSVKLKNKKEIKNRAKNIAKIRNITINVTKTAIKDTEQAMKLSQKTAKEMTKASNLLEVMI